MLRNTCSSRDPHELSRHIRETARRLFLENGIDNVSMHQIAKASLIGQGTLYRRYANKSDLCMDLMRENFQMFQNQVEEILEEAAHSRASAAARIRLVLEQQIRFLEKEANWLRVVQTPGNCERLQLEVYESPPYVFLHQTYKNLLTEAIETGETSPLDVPFTAHIMVTSLSPLSVQYLVRLQNYTAEEIIAHYTRAYLEPLFPTRS